MFKLPVLSAIAVLLFTQIAQAFTENDRDFLNHLRAATTVVSSDSEALLKDVNNHPDSYVTVAKGICRKLDSGMSLAAIRKEETEYALTLPLESREILKGALVMLNVYAPKFYCPEFYGKSE